MLTDDRKTLGAISIAIPTEVGGRVLGYDLLGSSLEYASKVIAEWLAVRTGRPCLVITNLKLGDFNLYREVLKKFLEMVEDVEEGNCRDNGC